MSYHRGGRYGPIRAWFAAEGNRRLSLFHAKYPGVQAAAVVFAKAVFFENRLSASPVVVQETAQPIGRAALARRSLLPGTARGRVCIMGLPVDTKEGPPLRIASRG